MLEKLKLLKEKLSALSSLPPLLFRLILSYGFFEPAMMKINNMPDIISWFESMNYPLPALNAYMAAGIETTGFILLFLGLGTRIISIPLSFVMLVAIFTVHLGNGFSAGSNGFEIPFYYLLMLFSLIITGPGKISIDYLIEKKYDQ